MPHATIIAGIPAVNNTLYHRIRFSAGDPAAIIVHPDAEGRPTRTLIIRDIEMDRARAHARADAVFCPADFTPEGGLSGDRETATAQSLAEFCRSRGIDLVTADRTLPLIFAHHLRGAGIAIEYDPDLGVSDRRSKDEQEIEALRHAQAITETAIRMACETIANASADADGGLTVAGQPLTSERVRSLIDIHLLERGCSNAHGSIVAGGSDGGDCHNEGSGRLFTGQPVIIDIFPQVRDSHYNGDCTRTVVHGHIPDELATMHATVLEAKLAAITATKPGTTGDAVHRATTEVITAAGYHAGMPPADAGDDFVSMPHGTGHGIGLDVHEPPLLDVNGPELMLGDALTIEPGLYCKSLGGVRIEDMVIVTAHGCDNLNTLPEGLVWS